MKKNLLFILLFFVTILVNAQQPLLFKIKYLPNRFYKMNVATNMNMTMDISGDSAKMNQIKSKGVKLPMTITSASDMDMHVKTGKVDAKTVFPIIFTYTNITSKQMVNDAETSKPGSPLIGLSIYGECTADGKIQVDSIPGKAINDQLKTTLTTTIDNISKQVQFPETPLHVGETFFQEVPLNLPIAGLNMKFIIKIVYKLTKVENNNAFFDLDESMTLDMSGQQNSVDMTASGTGKGQGKMVYDIAQNYTTTMKADLDFNFKMAVENMTMDCKATIASVNQTTITLEGK